MKKTCIYKIGILFLALLFVCLGGCAPYRQDSFEEYLASINGKYHMGFCDFETDAPEYFLPSIAFFDEFPYGSAEYHYRYPGMDTHAVSFLCVQYEAESYAAAKAYTLEKIPQAGTNRFTHNGYVFYENKNHADRFEESSFPKWFTMVSYHDEKHEIIFLGHHYSLKMKEVTGDNWAEFLNTYYGEYHDFDA